MKLVKEYLYEKFTEDSDPIEDMRIGLKPKIEALEKIYMWVRPEIKDYERIRNIFSKSNKNSEKERMYAQNMAKAITDPEKAYRRYKAAKYIGEINGKEAWDVTNIFLMRALELNKIS